MKLHPDFDRFLADDRRVDPFLELCRRHRLVAVFHAGAPGGPSAPERIVAAARRHPTVPVVLYHMGADGFDGGSGEGQKAAIAVVERSLTAGDANLYLETAHTPVEWIVEAVRRVGEDRVLFGSDATYYGTAHFERYAPIVSRLRRELPPPALAAVMGGNARRLFRTR
jgi:predicted TIM-barrel fold metal-dependent hydrolase